MDASDRATYAKGMFDTFMIAYPADDDIARAFGLDNCAADLKLSGEKIAEFVDDYYETTPKERDMPPFVVVNTVVVLGLCRQHINSERKSRGLTPLVSAP